MNGSMLDPRSEDFLRRCVQETCLLEAAARKPGNVHPQASFEDLTFDDFVAAGKAIAPPLAAASSLGVGPSVLAAVRATRELGAGNINLGIILLIAPLAAVPPELSLRAGLPAGLQNLTHRDAEYVFEAIRLANPGGLGRVAEADVSGAPAGTLLDVMRLAAGRDRVAWQYAHEFADVLDLGLPFLEQMTQTEEVSEEAIIELHLRFLAHTPDTLITRKCGAVVADEASRQARSVLDAGYPHTAAGGELLERFDGWLRADGHRRNPGTTADLVAASLFAVLRETRAPIRADWLPRLRDRAFDGPAASTPSPARAAEAPP